jgi:VWFA-related protein
LRALVVAIVTACLGPALRVAADGQGTASLSQPTFRAGTTLVEVSAVVTRDGRPVLDLRAEDFTVLDNGVPQSVVAFERVDLGRGALPSQRRDFVLVLDDLHIEARRTQATIDAALAFVDALGPHDRLAVVFTAPPQGALDLTTDREAARGRIRAFRGQYVPQALVRLRATTGSDEGAWRARDAMDVLKQVGRAVRSDAAERRGVLLISEGHPSFPTTVSAMGSRETQALAAEFSEVLREAALANVAIYTIDPRGLRAQDTASVPSRLSTPPAGSGPADAGPALSADLTGSLAALALNTGGIQTRWSNDLTKNVGRMLEDSRQYYRLAYVQPDPPPGRKQPPSRRITVKVARPGVEVRARRRYAPAVTAERPEERS